MISQLQLVLVLEARDTAVATAALDEVVGALDHPVTERFPVEEYTKCPDCWLAVVDLAPVDDDPADAITRLSARLAVSGWSVEDYGHAADTIWKRRDANTGGETAFVHPAVQWAHIQAFPPLTDQEPAEVEELVPEGSEGKFGDE